jgi:hypothetical protein
MKKKSPRDVPVFARHSGPAKPAGGTPPVAPGKGGARPAPPPPQVKPQSTSAKSGQRGQ